MSAYDTLLAGYSPLLWWKLADPPATTTVADSSGNGYTGSVTPNGGSVTFGGAGPVSGETSALFAGVTPYVLSGTLPTTQAPFTAIAWMKTTITGSTYGAEIVNTRPPGEMSFDLAYGVGNVASNFTCDFGTGAAWLDTGVAGTVTAPNDNLWHMVVVVATTTTYDYYLDGVSFASGSLAGTTLLCDATHPLTVAAYPALLGNSQFNGSLAQIALIPSALTAPEIAALFTAAAAAATSVSGSGSMGFVGEGTATVTAAVSGSGAMSFSGSGTAFTGTNTSGRGAMTFSGLGTVTFSTQRFLVRVVLGASAVTRVSLSAERL